MGWFCMHDFWEISNITITKPAQTIPKNLRTNCLPWISERFQNLPVLKVRNFPNKTNPLKSPQKQSQVPSNSKTYLNFIQTVLKWPKLPCPNIVFFVFTDGLKRETTFRVIYKIVFEPPMAMQSQTSCLPKKVRHSTFNS